MDSGTGLGAHGDYACPWRSFGCAFKNKTETFASICPCPVSLSGSSQLTTCMLFRLLNPACQNDVSCLLHGKEAEEMMARHTGIKPVLKSGRSGFDGVSTSLLVILCANPPPHSLNDTQVLFRIFALAKNIVQCMQGPEKMKLTLLFMVVWQPAYPKKHNCQASQKLLPSGLLHSLGTGLVCKNMGCIPSDVCRAERPGRSSDGVGGLKFRTILFLLVCLGSDLQSTTYPRIVSAPAGSSQSWSCRQTLPAAEEYASGDHSQRGL